MSGIFAGSVDADVNITMKADDKASAKIKTATDRINESWKSMRNEQRAVGRQFELNNRTFVATARAIQTVGNIAQRAIQVFQAWEIHQIRLSQATKNLRDITKELNEAVAEGDIEREIELREDQRIAQDELNRAQRDSILFYVLSGLAAAQWASSITTKTIPALQKLRSTLRGTNIQASKLQTTMTGAPAPTETETTPKTTQKPSAKSGKTPAARGGGGAARVGIGGASILIGGIINDVMGAEDPLGRLVEILRDPLNFSGKGRGPNGEIHMTVIVGDERKEITFDRNGKITYGQATEVS